MERGTDPDPRKAKSGIIRFGAIRDAMNKVSRNDYFESSHLFVFLMRARLAYSCTWYFCTAFVALLFLCKQVNILYQLYMP